MLVVEEQLAGAATSQDIQPDSLTFDKNGMMYITTASDVLKVTSPGKLNNTDQV